MTFYRAPVTHHFKATTSCTSKHYAAWTSLGRTHGSMLHHIYLVMWVSSMLAGSRQVVVVSMIVCVTGCMRIWLACVC